MLISIQTINLSAVVPSNTLEMSIFEELSARSEVLLAYMH